MAIALVNSTSYGNASASDNTYELSGITGITSGNTLILTANPEASPSSIITGITSLIDSAGNTWQYSASAAQTPPLALENGSGSTVGSLVAWCIGAESITSLTLTMAPGTFFSVFYQFGISQWSGIGSADTGGTTIGNSITAITTASLNLAGSGEIVILAANCADSFNSLPTGVTGFSGASDDGAGYILNQSGTVQYTYPGSPSYYSTAIQAFKPAATKSGGSGSPLPAILSTMHDQ
jgi:hypothetical protein